jgi:lipopolysaccharide export system permease protein
MSADNEMVSLRMTGMPMWRICAPVFLMAIALSGVCLYVNTSLAPKAKNSMKRLFYDLATSDPINLFQEGRVLDKLPGYRIYTGKRKDGGTLENLQIIKMEGNRAEQFIRARTAIIERKPGQLDFVLRLKDANFEEPLLGETGAVEQVKSPYFGESALSFPLGELKSKMEKVNASMKDTSTLIEEAHADVKPESLAGLDEKARADFKREARKDRSVALTEVSKRFSFSLACMTFALIGIPLGITAQRRETTAGFILSLVTAIVYFAFIMVADTMNENATAYPHLLMWVPNVLFLGIGSWLFLKLSRR